ncbi:hypothetical protein ABH935_006392 [Catenulispora sp. GAS73]|uniref:hypothetical protein n=1 Tax=Catenulispora sp. GAS73 TaxID=3156269 RepID=UPI003515EEB7
MAAIVLSWSLTVSAMTPAALTTWSGVDPNATLIEAWSGSTSWAVSVTSAIAIWITW